MLNSPMLSIFQHFHAIPLRSPRISLRSKWRLTGFSRRFTPKNPVRLHKPFGQLPRWGAKNVLPLNLTALPARGADDTRETCCQETFGHRLIYTRGKAAPSFLIPHSSFLIQESLSFPIKRAAPHGLTSNQKSHRNAAHFCGSFRS